MKEYSKIFDNINCYVTPDNIKTKYWLSPSFYFKRKFLKIVYDCYSLAKRSQYDKFEWAKASLRILKTLEASGVKFSIEGLKNVQNDPFPVIFIGNHMSTLETVILPSIIQPYKNVCFIVKKELLKVPLFSHVLSSTDPIVVGRNNPREDLAKVFEEGEKRIKKGISIILFPQKTRSVKLDRNLFNTLGIKLARKTNAKIIPFALTTDSWGNGRIIKDLGKIDVSKKVQFAFGEPFDLTSKDADLHKKVLDFIEQKLISWGRKDCL